MDCRARVKCKDNKMSTIWGVCYSYNNKTAKKFLENEILALMFLIASNSVEREEMKNENSF